MKRDDLPRFLKPGAALFISESHHVRFNYETESDEREPALRRAVLIEFVPIGVGINVMAKVLTAGGPENPNDVVKLISLDDITHAMIEVEA